MRNNSALKAHNVTRDQVLIEKGEIADTVWTRLRGLIGHRPLEAGEGLMIKPCSSIHTFFMGFPIDAIFVSEEGEVVGLAKELAPYQIGPIVRGAKFVLELPAGAITQTGTQVGDRVAVDSESGVMR